MAKVNLSQESYDELLADIKALRLQVDTNFEQWQDAKKKAGAWDKLKEELLTRAELLSKEMKGELIYCKDNFNNGVHSELFKILSRMDELDGVHEFSKLLSGLERGSDE